MNLTQRLASTVTRRLFLDRQLSFWLGEVNRAWSLGEVRARVVRVLAETEDTKTFFLKPSSGWRGHRAGQHAMVEVEIHGVRHRRTYSISSAPSDALLAITVKRTPDGRVSRWLHARVRAGHVLRLGPAEGELVLPDPRPSKLLLLSGGSGITPVMSILRDLAARGDLDDATFVHHARSRHDVIFRRELGDLAGRHPGLRLVLGLSDAAAGPGRFDEAQLRRLVPDFAERETFLCGPAGLMERAQRLWEREGAGGRLHIERFAPPPARAAVATPGAHIILTRSGRTVPVAAGTLLEQLERAGERPAYGCRVGICHTCKCRKRAGTVENLLTGAVSSEPDEDIQLCISTARSDVELGL